MFFFRRERFIVSSSRLVLLSVLMAFRVKVKVITTKTTQTTKTTETKSHTTTIRSILEGQNADVTI